MATRTTIWLIVILLTSTIESNVREGRHHRRFFFSNHKTTTIATPPPDDSSFGNKFTNWLNGLISTDSNKDKNSNSFSKLALLKSFLSSSSSSSNDKGSKLDKIFELLNYSATDDKNKSSSSSSKVNRLLEFFGGQGSTSNNVQLALKLLNIAQGNAGLSSLSVSDMKMLFNFASFG